MTGGAALRVGDAERDSAARWLAEHFAAGRLTQVEYDERLSAALSARTRADLDRLFADLPLLDEQRPVLRRPRRRHLLVPALAFVVLALLASSVHAHTSVAAFPGPPGPGRIVMHDWTPWPLLPPLLLIVAVALAARLVGRRLRGERHRRW